MNTVKLGFVQMNAVAGKAKNLSHAEEQIKILAQKGAQVICLQELFCSLYFCNVEDYGAFDLAEEIPGPTTERFSVLAKEYSIVIVASLFEKRTSGLYHNTTAVIDADGQYLGKYRKMHIPDDPGFYEKFYFTPGDLGYKVFQTRYLKIGVLICWDQWYPEAARITSLKGAEVLFYPTAIGWSLKQDEKTNQAQYQAWQTIQRSHAIANGIPVLSVNRVGIEDGVKFWGGSFLSDAFGVIQYQASHEMEESKVVEIELSQSNSTRIHWPFLRDRRIDSYEEILKRFIDPV